MEKVSIVIPTRNRAHLVKFAIESAVKQTYQNLEIVICNNHCEDNTDEVVNSFDQNKIIYIKTNKVLSMPDNWDFALTKASGDYILFLTDDSYLLPKTVETIIEEMDKFKTKIATWKHAAYFTSNWLEKARKNILYIPNTSTKTYVLDSKEYLEKLYNMTESIFTLIPKSLNSLCHKSIVEKIIKTQGRFFLPPCPDYTSAASVLLNSDKYLLIDQLLYLDGVTTASIGAISSFNVGKSTQNFIKEFDSKLDDVYFQGISTSSANIARGLEEVKKFYPNNCPELNIKKTLCTIIDRLLKLETNKVNNKDSWIKFNNYLTHQSRTTKLAILKQKVISKIKWGLIKIIRSHPALERFETLRGMKILKGEDYGFNNIEEAGKFLASLNNSK